MTTGKIDKEWGFEIIWANNPKYCGKILVFTAAGSKSPMVFHKDTEKSWFVNSGKFIVRWIDTKTSKVYEKFLNEGEVWSIQTMTPYQLESVLPESMIFESGTTMLPEDIYTIFPGNR